MVRNAPIHEHRTVEAAVERERLARRAQAASAAAEDRHQALIELQLALRDLDADLRRLADMRSEIRRRYGRLIPRFVDRLICEAERSELSAKLLCRRLQDLAKRL